MFPGDTLAPSGQAVGLDLDQQDAARGGDAKAGLEGVCERQVDLAQVNGIDLHGLGHVRFLCFHPNPGGSQGSRSQVTPSSELIH
jgi:hypothetical protein